MLRRWRWQAGVTSKTGLPFIGRARRFAIDGAAIWANGLGDDQRGNRRHFGTGRGTARIEGENPFKVRAYINAARAIETFGGNIPDLQDEEAVAKNPGFNFVTKIPQISLDNFAVVD